MEKISPSETHAPSVLIVSGSEKGIEYFEELAGPSFSQIVHAQSAAQAAELVMHTPFDVVIVNAPLADELGDGFAVRCTENSYAGVLLLIKAELADTAAAAENAGVLVLTKPAGKGAIQSAVKLACAVGRRLFKAQSKADTLKSKMDELKTVNRAKWLLIGKLGMNEADAHRYIEKLAMDTRQTRREIAESVIKTYEN
ncbi:MAG: ANTAR domain-containing protein [Clostridiales bacterium]|jgi:hypothetical protein|nr:ANTAR domain-containing protein [Clostridiales bacterium]